MGFLLYMVLVPFGIPMLCYAAPFVFLSLQHSAIHSNSANSKFVNKYSSKYLNKIKSWKAKPLSMGNLQNQTVSDLIECKIKTKADIDDIKRKIRDLRSEKNEINNDLVADMKGEYSHPLANSWNQNENKISSLERELRLKQQELGQIKKIIKNKTKT